MNKSVAIALFIVVMVAVGLFLRFTNEYGPSYLSYHTTWAGQPGYLGQLHRDGWYTFYDQRGNAIASLPSGEAFHLH